MISRLLLATAAIAASSALALAQDMPPPKPAPGMAAPDAGNPPHPPPDARGGRHHGPRKWWRHHGSRGGKGFTLSLGDGGRLKVDCGDEPLKGCVDAVQPLLDQLDGGMMGDEPADEMQQDDMDAPAAPSSEPGYHAEPPAPAPAPGTPLKGDQ